MTLLSPPLETIDYRTCRQGGWADCWFLSALVSLAFKRPHDVAKLIRDNGDGSFAVTFPYREPVVVRPEEGSSACDGVWVPVIEAAAAKFITMTHGRCLTF